MVPDTPPTGLSKQDAAVRLARDGPNALPEAERRSPLRIVAEVVREPMFALLLGAAGLYAAIGDLGEALVLFAFACLSVSIAVIQQGRSERVLEALRVMTSPRALVVRDGERRRIPGREVVQGDLLVLSEGDRVPADAVLISGDFVQVDESLLTGESVPVRKRPAGPAASESAAPGGDGLSNVFGGTLIVRGAGLAVVMATGDRSELGRIGHAVRNIKAETPRLQAQTRLLVLTFAAVGTVLSLLAVLLYGLLRGDWLQAVLGGIALEMSMLPEEFPLVLTVFMVMGAWRLSRSNVLTRRPAAIETLGAATVLCTDKTGTLTQNRMSVVCLESAGERWSRAEPTPGIRQSRVLAELLEVALLASERETLDPMDRALHGLAECAGRDVEGPQRKLVRDFPLRPELLAVTRIWCVAGQERLVVASKGAPEAVAQLCGLNAGERDELRARVDELARQGMRVLGVAAGHLDREDLPEATPGMRLAFLGLLGFADPLRESVPDAVAECKSDGIRVFMITGDYPETARAIARQAGIGDGEVLSGAELDRLDEQALGRCVRSTTVFARITPQQKLRIVEALKAGGEIVAMTGDGVNDAAALKAAHIGIAMGGRGTDVAREAASLVLLDDDFNSIVRAVRLGRRIYDNLRKAMGYILAIHLPIAGLALLPVLIGQPLVLTPMLIAFLELIIDPTCSVVLEAEREESDVMRRPPRNPRSALLSRSLVVWSLLQGTLALLLVAAVFLAASWRGMPPSEVRSLAFLSLVLVNVALIFANRSFSASLLSAVTRRNRTLWWVLALAGCTLTAMLALPGLRAFLGLGLLHADDLALSMGVALGLLIVLESGKAAWGRRLTA
jgi:Ca2+-transporting ATPase